MAETDGASLNPIARISGLVELMTTLDTRILAALDSLEQIRTTMAGFEDLGTEGDVLVADVRSKVQKMDARLDRLDERINRDIDEVKAALMEKIAELDTKGLGERFDRLEASIMNIERATMDLDQGVQGAIEALPNRLTRKIKEEGHEAQQRSEDLSPPPDHVS